MTQAILSSVRCHGQARGCRVPGYRRLHGRIARRKKGKKRFKLKLARSCAESRCELVRQQLVDSFRVILFKPAASTGGRAEIVRTDAQARLLARSVQELLSLFLLASTPSLSTCLLAIVRSSEIKICGVATMAKGHLTENTSFAEGGLRDLSVL